MSHVIAGMDSAMARPKKQNSERDKADSGEKSPERQQHHQHEACGLHRHQLLEALQKHEIHRDDDRHPVRGLGPDEFQPGLAVGRARPSEEDAQKPHGDGEEFPIAIDRAAGEIAVGHAEDRQRQHRDVRQVSQHGPHRKELVRMGLSFRVRKLNRVGHAQSNLRRSPKLFIACQLRVLSSKTRRRPI